MNKNSFIATFVTLLFASRMGLNLKLHVCLSFVVLLSKHTSALHSSNNRAERRIEDSSLQEYLDEAFEEQVRTW